MTDLAALRRDIGHALSDAEPGALAELIGLCAETQARAMALLTTPAPLPPQPEQGALLVDAAALAERIGLSKYWLRDAANHNRIPHHRVGRRVLFDPDEVVSAVKAMAARAAATKTGAQDRRSWAHRLKKRQQSNRIATAMKATHVRSVQPFDGISRVAEP